MSKIGNDKLLAQFGLVFDTTKWYMYCIQCKLNTKAYYGKTDNPYNRWQRHQWEANNGGMFAIHRSMREHGIDNFVFEVIEVIDTAQRAADREKELIALNKTNACRYG